jgi:Leucine-rich repeat (LRR) protein
VVKHVLLVAGLSFALVAGSILWAGEDETLKAVEAIEKAGGRVKIDTKTKGRPVVLVDLGLTNADDKVLAEVKAFKSLERLSLAGTQITDAGMEHIKGLSRLQVLGMPGTKITDKGLAALKGLKEMRILHVNNTKITDVGLAHLHGLSKLEGINLLNTSVSDTGVQELKKAIPKLQVMR